MNRTTHAGTAQYHRDRLSAAVAELNRRMRDCYRAGYTALIVGKLPVANAPQIELQSVNPSEAAKPQGYRVP